MNRRNIILSFALSGSETPILSFALGGSETPKKNVYAMMSWTSRHTLHAHDAYIFSSMWSFLFLTWSAPTPHQEPSLLRGKLLLDTPGTIDTMQIS